MVILILQGYASCASRYHLLRPGHTFSSLQMTLNERSRLSLIYAAKPAQKPYPLQTLKKTLTKLTLQNHPVPNFKKKCEPQSHYILNDFG